MSVAPSRPLRTEPSPSAPHRVALPGTGWHLWQDAVLRTAGFPVEGLERLADPECARAADDHLAGAADLDTFTRTFTEAAGRASGHAYDIAADPLFREAVSWQNTTAMHALDGILRSGRLGRANHKRRRREELVARYWQRYCAKNETVGFFGPVNWATLDPRAVGTTIESGPRLLTDRMVFFEHWALASYADTLTADPQIRPWLPVALQPHFVRDGRQVLRPTQRPAALSLAEAAILACCEPPRPAAEVARSVIAEPDSPLRKSADVYAILDRLVERGIVRWGADLPQSPAAEHILRQRIAEVGDPVARERAAAGLARLSTARDEIRAAAGDTGRLSPALAALDATFVELTGREPRRRAGQTYAGRALCYEDTVRDLAVTFGAPVLDLLAAPLGLLLQAARWLSVAVADAYREALDGVFADLLAGTQDTDVPLGALWYLAQGPLFGAEQRPVDRVAAQFVERWARLFGLASVVPGTHRLQFRSAELADEVAALFPADGPGWRLARLHSPDVHLCARSAEALAAGDFYAVLGEMHAAWATLDSAVFVSGHPQPARLVEAMRADVGEQQFRLLLPTDWPEYSGRVARCLSNPTDIELGIVAAPGADPDRHLPVTALTVRRSGTELTAHAADGRSWPLIEVFGELITVHAVNAFKLLAAAPHTPRITVDRVVVARETWRSTLGESGLAEHTGYAERYLAARRFRDRLGLPERVFVKLEGEAKPCYLDFTSPLLVSSFCSMAHAARVRAGDGLGLVVSEMLPGPDDAWVPDAAGGRYLSELRIQASDLGPTGMPAGMVPGRRGGQS